MGLSARREVHFARSAVALEYEGKRAAAIIDFLFQHIDDTGPARPHVTYRIDQQATELVLQRAEVTLYRGVSDAECADILLGDSTHELADRSTDGLLFHAAALAWQGRGLLLPGRVAAGKTTLSAWLTTCGFDFLSDELIFVPTGSATLQALTRPLNVKSSARSVLRPYFDFDRHAAQLLSTPRGDLIPAELLRPANKLNAVTPHAIILPQYVAGADFKLAPLSSAQAAFALIDTVVNARNLPDHGLPELARLARSIPAYQLTYNHFAQIGDRLEELM
ncbi:MAG TPA: hypothetical protein VMP08_02520 [Anaerolineae bacterium]|nr:hypothetical protein [Anaerolineae bacterium]